MKAKIEGGEVKKTPTSTKSSGEVVDLLAALQRSVDAAKTARGESSGDGRDEDEKPAKKAAAKKSDDEGRRQEGDHEEGRGQEDRQEGQLARTGRPPRAASESG